MKYNAILSYHQEQNYEYLLTTCGLCTISGKSLPRKKAAQEGSVPEKKPQRSESHTDWEPKASTQVIQRMGYTAALDIIIWEMTSFHRLHNEILEIWGLGR